MKIVQIAFILLLCVTSCTSQADKDREKLEQLMDTRNKLNFDLSKFERALDSLQKPYQDKALKALSNSHFNIDSLEYYDSLKYAIGGTLYDSIDWKRKDIIVVEKKIEDQKVLMGK